MEPKALAGTDKQANQQTKKGNVPDNDNTDTPTPMERDSDTKRRQRGKMAPSVLARRGIARQYL